MNKKYLQTFNEEPSFKGLNSCRESHRRSQGGGTGERSPPPKFSEKIRKREKSEKIKENK